MADSAAAASEKARSARPCSATVNMIFLSRGGRFFFEREAEMKRYEVVREIENNCKRNQMRDVLFFEVETDDPVEWVRQEVKGKEVEISTETNSRGELTVFAESAGLPQKFFFTEL